MSSTPAAPDEGNHYHTLNLLGGRLPLDFTNTVHARLPVFGTEYIRSYADLLNWCVHADVLTKDEADHLRAAAAAAPGTAEAVYHEAIRLRETIARLFEAIANGSPPAADDLDALNAALAAALPNLVVRHGERGFAWEWGGSPDALDRMLWIIARETAELLTTDDLTRIRQCPAPDGCGWLFLDTSKNRSRRWCSMESCGNAAKARRHYQRGKQT